MQLGWIDFSKEDRQKAMDVINFLSEQGAVDELGIGIVRDAFANYFFPGTSTIQTRAKYFLIVPYILKEAVDGRYGKNINKIMKAIDLEEKECGIRFLKANQNAEGIIGKRVLPKGWVARKPSDIYWNGIRTYGIFKDHSLSIAEYISFAVKLKSQKLSVRLGNRGDDTEDADRDDNDAGDITNIHFWDLPVYTTEWKENLSIELLPEEAFYLDTQIQKHTQGTLMAYILKNHIDLDEYDGFASMAEALCNRVNPELAYMMKLACDFNELVYMSRVRYNMILSEGENDEAREEWEFLSKDCRMRASVDLRAVFEKLNITNPKTYSFLCMLQEAFQRDDIELADSLIKKREIQLKGINRAKLNRTKEFDHSQWIGGGWLDYRFYNARRIIDDIYHGEVGAHVQAR